MGKNGNLRTGYGQTICTYYTREKMLIYKTNLFFLLPTIPITTTTTTTTITATTTTTTHSPRYSVRVNLPGVQLNQRMCVCNPFASFFSLLLYAYTYIKNTTIAHI